MKPQTILIVDDTPTNILFVQGILASEGFHTLTAGDGNRAVALSRSQQPDLVLLDVVMPGETGFETCNRLKSDPTTADIPVIFLSALDDGKSRVEGLKAGAVDFVSKPVYGEELLARVRVHLRIRESNQVLVEKQHARLEQLRSAQRAILLRAQDCPKARFEIFYEPLEEAGGDFYDVVEIDRESFGYFVADVSGHGVTAGFLTSAIKALLHQYTGPLYAPEDTLRGVDAVMRRLLGQEQYLTACFASLNRRAQRLSVVSAGHPPLILLRENGRTESITMSSDPLGMFSSAVLQRRDLAVFPGDRFFLYTDGLIESTPGGGRIVGISRLMEACLANQSTPLAEAPQRIVEAVRSGAGPAGDDLLLMAVEVGP